MFKLIVEQGQLRSEARTGARLGSCLEARGGDADGCIRAPIGGASGRAQQGSGRSRAGRTRLRPSDGSARPFHWPMDDPEVAQVPGEVGPELRTMVRLDALDCHRQAAPHFLDEFGGRFDGVVSIHTKDTIPGGLVDGRELVKAAATELEMLDIDLDR